MNRGGKTSPASGFTIVETLIVMAVTSALLVSAMVSMSGRQVRTEFQVGREAIVRELQSVISQIESGRYKATNTFSCTKISFFGAYPSFTEPPAAGSQGQGTNEGCIFLGNALVFGRSAGEYSSYVIAGASSQQNSPYAVGTISDAHPASPASSRTDMRFPNGFTYAGARYLNNNNTYMIPTLTASQPVVVRLMTDLRGEDMVAGKLAGSQRVIVHSTEPFNSSSDVLTIKDASPIEQPKKSFEVCLASGGTDQSIIVSIGNGKSNKVTSVVKNGRTCGW